MKLAQKLALRLLQTKLKITGWFSERKAAEMAFVIFCTPRRKLRSSKYPVPAVFESAEKFFVPVEGRKVSVFRWNKGGEKKVMVLHGFESSSRNFEKYITLLAAKGYEVIAADAPAHGDSEGDKINLPLYVRTLQEVVAVTGPVQCYMAHSFGGLALAHFLESSPHDSHHKVALIAPATESSTAIDGMFELLQLNDSIRKEFDKIIFEISGYYPAHFSIARALKHIRATILWIHDRDDTITPLKDVAPIIASNPSNIAFVLTEKLGHRKIYRDEKIIKEVVDFL